MDKLELAKTTVRADKNASKAAKYSLLLNLVGYGEIKERHAMLSSNE